MYIPGSFEVKDAAVLRDFVVRHPFATVISANSDDVPYVTHIPLVLKSDGGAVFRLVGHVARANPHSRAIVAGSAIMAIFHGPHAYISPGCYEQPKASVPTWNYAVVHAFGAPEVIVDQEAVLSHLRDLSELHEGYSGNDAKWSMDLLDSSLISQLVQAICVFSIAVTKFEGKFKLGQNRKPEDVKRIAEFLLNHQGVDEQELGRFMQDYLPKL